MWGGGGGGGAEGRWRGGIAELFLMIGEHDSRRMGERVALIHFCP